LKSAPGQSGDGCWWRYGNGGWGEDKYGKCIIIVHDETYQTLYAHLSTIDVAIGEKVTPGQQIGAVGNSGASMGAHLYYEVFRNGKPVNPMAYLP
jgi:murein DD-endopeptidase MepM/ murein hydrolase activator NlpD